MAYADLNYTVDQINEAISKALEGGSGGSASIPVVVVEGATPTQELQPNTYYEFGEVTSLTITLAPEQEGIYNEYMFEFTSGTTATTLSLPSDIKWINSKDITIENNKIYQISIVNNIALFCSIDKKVLTMDITVDGSPLASGLVYLKLNDVLIYDYGALQFNTIEYNIGDTLYIHGSEMDTITIDVIYTDETSDTISAGNTEASLSILKPINNIVTTIIFKD